MDGGRGWGLMPTLHRAGKMRILFGVSLISMSLGHNLPRITHIYMYV